MKQVPKVGWGNSARTTTFEVRSVYELLDVIRQKPGIFIGERSITALQHFIYGFIAALDATENPFEPETPSFSEFHDWIAKQFGYSSSGLGWRAMLLEKAGSELDAYERFFVELDAFRGD